MSTETVHSSCVLEALFLLTMVINGTVAFCFRFVSPGYVALEGFKCGLWLLCHGLAGQNFY